MTADPRIVYLTNVRLSYPNLAAPQAMRSDDGTERKQYNAAFLLEKDDPQFSKFVERCTVVLQEAWKEHAALAINAIWADRKSRCFSAGEEHVDGKTLQVRGGYAGKMVISANSGDRQPQAIDATGAVVPPENTMAVMATLRKLYGGCRVNVAVRPWAQMPTQKNRNTKGIRCDLVAIQFARDDTPFGEAAPDVSGIFGAVEQPQQAAAPVAPAGMPPPPFGVPPAAAPAPFGAPPAGMPVMPPFPGAH